MKDGGTGFQAGKPLPPGSRSVFLSTFRLCTTRGEWFPWAFVYHIASQIIRSLRSVRLCPVPRSMAPSPLHLTGAFALALGSGRKHRQGSSGLALSGAQDAGHTYTAGLPRQGEAEVACRPHSALQPRPHWPWLFMEASAYLPLALCLWNFPLPRRNSNSEKARDWAEVLQQLGKP